MICYNYNKKTIIQILVLSFKKIGNNFINFYDNS